MVRQRSHRPSHAAHERSQQAEEALAEDGDQPEGGPGAASAASGAAEPPAAATATQIPGRLEVGACIGTRPSCWSNVCIMCCELEGRAGLPTPLPVTCGQVLSWSKQEWRPSFCLLFSTVIIYVPSVSLYPPCISLIFTLLTWPLSEHLQVVRRAGHPFNPATGTSTQLQRQKCSLSKPN